MKEELQAAVAVVAPACAIILLCWVIVPAVKERIEGRPARPADCKCCACCKCGVEKE